MEIHKVSLDETFERFDELWSPRIVARTNGQDVRIAKVEGEHVWHVHDDEDEFFLCLTGRFTIELRDGVVTLDPGEAFVVPAGTEHKPTAIAGTRILMVEPAGTSTVGDRHDGATDHLGVHAGIDVRAS